MSNGFVKISLIVNAVVLIFFLTQNCESKVIPNAYIVQVSDSVDPHSAARAMEAFTQGQAGHVYTNALKGFSIRVPPGILKSQLLSLPGIITVDPDLEITTCAQTIPTGIRRIAADLNVVAKINGLDERVDVDIAIIDTGIDFDHPDLNVVGGRHFYTVKVGNAYKARQDDNYDDENGHGTHVAGIAAALDNNIGSVGVAPGARLWAIRVLDPASADLSNMIAGIDWITARADQIEVANISLSANGNVSTLRTAIANSVAKGIVYFVAAGNDAKDVFGTDGVFNTSDDYIPAAYPEVTTVSAMVDMDGLPGGLGSSHSWGADDSFASISNYSKSVVSSNPVVSPGKAIDLLMPGANIYSTWLNGGYTTIGGTSMASPHAAGLAALYIAEYGRANNAAEVYAIRQALIDGGVAQDSSEGLKVLNDRDINWENIGWAASYFIITGYVTDSQTNLPFENVLVTADNGGGSDITDAEGYYEIEVPYKWDGTIIPSISAYRFEPPSISYTNVETDHHEQNFAGTLMTYSISGTIQNSYGVPIEGVTFVTDEGSSDITDADGFYEVWVNYGWSGTVTPSKNLYTFNPNSRAYNNMLQNQTDQDYIAENIYDLDFDGCIGLGDLVVMSSQWLEDGVFSSDFNLDNTVNLLDYAKFAKIWTGE